MKHKIVCIILMFSIAILMGQTVSAADNDQQTESSTASSSSASNNKDAKVWQITLRAQILSHQGNRVAVYIANPNNMKIEDTDSVSALQYFTLNRETKYIDKSGNTIDDGIILAGQYVKVTFQYAFIGEPRKAQPKKCLQIQITDEIDKSVKTIAPTELPANTVVGTLLSQENNLMQVYVEGGNLFNEGFMASGKISVKISGVSIKSTDGKAIRASEIEPMQRILLQASSSEWAESYPPSYAGGTFSSISVLSDGEKLLATDSFQMEVTMFTGKNQQTVNIKNFTIISKVQGYLKNLTASSSTGSRTSENSIVVYIFEDGSKVKYVFLQNGMVQRFGTSEQPEWFNAPADAYSYLKGLLADEAAAAIVD